MSDGRYCDITIHHGDCLDVMPMLANASVDLVLTDPPYGTTDCKWDSVIPLRLMWEQLTRVVKPNAAIVLMASQPFTSKLVYSNLRQFKYCWVWDKVNRRAGFLNAKKQPLRVTEDICVFYQKQAIYNPQMIEGKPYCKSRASATTDLYGNRPNVDKVRINGGDRYPQNLLCIKGQDKIDGRLHPTQKPIALMEYLIRTYTNPGALVLDFTMGSGTTLIAARNTGRSAIGIELEQKYCDIARKRLSEFQSMLPRAVKELTR